MAPPPPCPRPPMKPPTLKSALLALPSAAATWMPERASASSMLVCASLNLSPPAAAPKMRPAVPRWPPRPPMAAHAARIVLGEDDSRRHDEIRCCHLAASHVRALAQLAGLLERALLHHVLHADATLDDEEAVRLLDHEPEEPGRGSEAIARQHRQYVALRLHDGERAHGPVTSLEVGRRADGAARTGRALHRAAALPFLHVRDALGMGGNGQAENAGQQTGKERTP